ncbi:MAG: hypothetical protein JO117_01070 [Verrucomicrobia bacterium]|nr:hypothetical protein [Verrucomicrobiota bacterium]
MTATDKTQRGARHFRRQRGSTLVLVLVVICILSTVAAGILFSANARYHSTYQSASWQEALIGCEAGVDIAMNELRRHVINNTPAFQNWATATSGGVTYANQGRAFPSGDPQMPFLMQSVHGGEGASMLGTRVFVDVPGCDAPPTPNTSFAQTAPPSIDPFINEQRDNQPADPTARWWYRIRALGYAGVSGPLRANLDARDNRLRKFSFFNDWRTNQPVNPNTTGPYVSRLIEVVAKPLTDFRNALMAEKSIDLGNQDVLIDSYDSSKGLYSSLNTGNMGNLATNGSLINANGASVMGDAMTNDGTVDQGENVSGQQRADFYQELPPVKDLTGWATVPLGATVTTPTTFTASSDRSNPTRVRLNGIDLSAGGITVSVVGPMAGVGGAPRNTPSYIKFYVQGDIVTGGASTIELAPGVMAIFYVTGNVNLQGHGFTNDDFLASRLLINGIQPPANADGTYPSRSITIATDQDFEGIVYAPNHDVRLALNVGTATAQGTGTAPTDTTQITTLQAQLAAYQSQYASDMAAYNKELAKYQKTGAPGQQKKVASDLAAAQADQANITATLNQLNLLVSGNTSQQDDRLRGYNGVYGTFVGRTINVASKTHIHYDEVLREAGPVNHYQIVNWFEDQASRATVNW